MTKDTATDLVVITPAELDADVQARIAAIDERVVELVKKSKAPATIAAYDSDMEQFSKWCTQFDYPALPTDEMTLMRYLAAHADTLKPSTLGRRLSAIKRIHATHKLTDPVTEGVKLTLESIRREKGSRQKQAAAVSTEDLAAAISALDLNTPRGLRDRAVLTIGYGGALRRSEIVGMDIEHIKDLPKGLEIFIPFSKGDQTGEGQLIAIDRGEHRLTSPTLAYREWVRAANITTGPVFRPITTGDLIREERMSTQTVNRIVKLAAAAAGLDVAHFSAHSLRVGHVTTAMRAGVRDIDVMQTTRHKSLSMVHRYDAGALLWDHNSSASLGL